MSAIIGVDWGSTSLRAFLYDADGQVVEQRTSVRGVSIITDGGFETVLQSILKGWLGPGTKVVMSGMIGSRNGWVEAPYVSAPTDLAALARGAIRIPSSLANCFIVPGVSIRAPNRAADVMRGEETLLLGAGVRNGLVILPGIHSKWAQLAVGKIAGFSTAFSGELHTVLLRHSMLGRLADKLAEHDERAFAQGVSRSLDGLPLLTTLFSARAEVLTGGMQGDQVSSYLSGLLIGAEVAAADIEGKSITLIGDRSLCQRYKKALALAGVNDVDHIEGDTAAAAGLWQVGKECR